MKRAVAGALLALAALLLTACGGGDSDQARTLIRETFGNPAKIRSGDVALSLQISAKGSKQLGDKPIQVRFTGPFTRNGPRQIPRFDFHLTASVGGQSFNAGATSTGQAGFVSLQGKSYALPAAGYASFRKSFQQVAKTAAAPTRSTKLSWFENPKVAGEEDIAGVTTEHVTGDVDLAKLLDSLARNQSKGSPGFSPGDRRQVEQAIQDAQFEFWTGKDDHLLRRVRASFRLAVPASSRAQLGGLQAADVSVDYQLSSLNQPQTISAPANPRPVTELSKTLQSYAQALQALVAGASGGSGSGSGGSGSSGLSPKLLQYNQCVQAAGGNIAAQQRCAALLR